MKPGLFCEGGVDPASPEAAAQMLEHAKDLARELFSEFGSLLMPFAVFAARSDPETQSTLPRPKLGMMVISPASTESPATKTSTADAIADVARRSDATGVAFVAESWFLEAKGEEACKELEKHSGEGLSKAPGRREGLMITFQHHATGSQVLVAEIVRSPGAKPTLKEFAELLPDGQHTGRFADLLGRGVA